MDKFNSSFYELDGHSIEAYEASHKPRLDFLVEDLKLHDIQGKHIGDFGCGYAPIFRRLVNDKDNTFFGYDGDNSYAALDACRYHQCDLNQRINTSESFDGLLDIAFCFETLEHLTNPYVCLTEIKRILKKDGTLYLSIPHEACTHNTIYPGLFYPVGNFIEFLGQMAFEIQDHRVHDKAFKQHVFILKNLDWSACRMKWHKHEDKFRGKTPTEQVNL